MNSRQRVLAALKHQEPDRLPLDLGSFASTIETVPYNNLKQYLGIDSKTTAFNKDHIEPDEEILEKFAIDTRYVRIGPPTNFAVEMAPDNSYIDEWGTRHVKPESSLYYEPVGPYPLENAGINDLKKYQWPDPNDPGRIDGLAEKAKALFENTTYAIVADAPFLGPLEFSWLLLRGPDFLTDLIENKRFAKALLEIITDIHIQFYDRYLGAVGEYIQVVAVADDLGMQDRSLMSPELYKEMIKPSHERLWGFIKKKTNAYLFLHSCGSIFSFIPDLIELGVDIINPVQVSAKNMESPKLKKEFGADVTFWGGIDTQRVMPMGSPDDVEAEVRKRIKDFAPGGGYVLAASHNIQADVKPENVCRMYEAAQKFGRYPIRL